MLDHNRTPRMSRHALERCKEMGIPAKAAKAIFRNPAVVRPSAKGHPDKGHPVYIVTSDLSPLYAIVVADEPGRALVLTVVFRTSATYVRDGATYRVEKRQGGV